MTTPTFYAPLESSSKLDHSRPGPPIQVGVPCVAALQFFFLFNLFSNHLDEMYIVLFLNFLGRRNMPGPPQTVLVACTPGQKKKIQTC